MIENNNNNNNNNNNKRNDKFSMLDFVEFLSSDSDSAFDVEEEPDTPNDEARTDSGSDREVACEPDDETIVEHVARRHDTQKTDIKKKETLSLIQQFHTHIIALEKEKKSLLHSKNRQDGHAYGELEDIEQKYNESRKKEKNEIQQNLNRISTKIDKFKRDKEDVRKCGSYLEKIKLVMEDIEENVMQFKEKQRTVYEDLMAEEKSLTCDLEAFQNKINLWQQAGDKPISMKKVQEQNKKDVLMPKEVAEFENFLLMTGGHQGGWDDIDHQTFLKMHKQHKKNDKVVSACICDIPTQSEEDIVQHVQWYEEYCILKERKRGAIRLWKNLKENEREDMLKNVQLDTVGEERRRKKKEGMMEKEREERFQKLKEHKEKQQVEEEREQQMKRDLEQQVNEKLKLKNMLEEQKRLDLKVQVEDYRVKKKEEEEILRNAQEEKLLQGRQIISDEEKCRIRERNEKLVTSKQRLKQKEDYERQEKEKRLDKLKKQVSVTAERDPNRLFKLTAGWEHRKEDTEKTKGTTATSGARLMPHRAVPSWRQGMSG